MKTHRCEMSLKNEISIRYDKPFKLAWLNEGYQDTWSIFKATFDYDYDVCHYECVVEDIKYCPYCGEKLK